MGPLGDDGNEMTSRHSSEALSEADADALLSGRTTASHDELREIISLMRTAAVGPAPTPTAALADVLNDGFDPLPVASSQRGRRWSARVVLAAAAAMTVALGAATANALPAPIQAAVAHVIGAVTPLELPRPPADARTGSDNEREAADEPPDPPFEQPNRTAETAAHEPSDESGDSTPVLPETAPLRPKAPAVVTPSRRPAETATATDEPDEPTADGQESDEADFDEPDTDEPEQPESGEVDQDDPEDRDLHDPGPPELEGDEPDADA